MLNSFSCFIFLANLRAFSVLLRIMKFCLPSALIKIILPFFLIYFIYGSSRKLKHKSTNQVICSNFVMRKIK